MHIYTTQSHPSWPIERSRKLSSHANAHEIKQLTRVRAQKAAAARENP